MLIRKLLKQSEKSETKKEKIQCLDIDNNINTISRPALSLSDGETESLGTSQHGIAHQELDTSQKNTPGLAWCAKLGRTDRTRLPATFQHFSFGNTAQIEPCINSAPLIPVLLNSMMLKRDSFQEIKINANLSPNKKCGLQRFFLVIATISDSKWESYLMCTRIKDLIQFSTLILEHN